MRVYIKQADIAFWLVTCLVAMMLNIVLLLRREISGQMAFSMIFLYLGIWGWISYYVIRLIKEYPQLIVEDKPAYNPLDELLEQELEEKE